MSVFLQRIGLLGGSGGPPTIVNPPSYSNFNNVKFLSALDVHPWVDESNVARGSTYIGLPVIDATKTIFGQSMTSYDGDDDGSHGTVYRNDCLTSSGPFWVGCYIRISDDQLTGTGGRALINFREQDSLHWGMTLSGLRLGFIVWKNNSGVMIFSSVTDSDVFEAGKTYLVGVGRIATSGDWKFWVGEVGVDAQCTVRKTIVDGGNMSSSSTSIIRIGFSTFGGNGGFLKGHMGEAIVIFGEPFVTGDFDMPTVPWNRS